jgi:hypothetical protein
MPITDGQIRRWLTEETSNVARADQPNSLFGFTFRTANGLQLLAFQPAGKRDQVILSGTVSLGDQERVRIGTRITEMVLGLQRDLAIGGYIFEIKPNEQTPETIAIAVQLWDDHATKGDFMRALQRVVNGVVLIIVTFRKYLSGTG